MRPTQIEGICSMRRKFLSFLLALLFANGSFATDAVMELGEKYSTDDVTVNGKPAIKLGRSTGGGDMRVTVGAGAKVLTLHVVAWDKEGGAKLLIEAPDGVGIDPAEIELVADVNVYTGSGNDFTIEDEDAFKFEIALSGIETETVLSLTSEKRCVVWGATYETESSVTPTEPCITASGTCGVNGDNLTWELSCDGVLTISGSGAMKDFPYDSSPWKGVNSPIKEVIVENGVTSIGDDAFYKCTNLTSVEIPNSVTGIGDYAFFECSSLTSITCEAITPPALGDNVFHNVDKSIPLYVYGSSIAAYRVANRWKDFNVQALPGTEPCITASGTCGAQGNNLTWELSCDGVLTISGTGEMTHYVEDNNSPWYSNRESISQVVIDDGVTSIGDEAFYECSSLTSIEIPNSVTSIGVLAFSNCSGLTSVTIPNSVTSIGLGAFADCSSMTSIYIPNRVTGIGVEVFSGCSSLTSIYIPNSVTGIGGWAFRNCSGLTYIACKALTPPALGDEVFSDVDHSIPLYVPSSSIDAYKAADQWKDFTNIQCYSVSGTCGANGDNLTWELSCDSVLIISGTGAMMDGDAPWYETNYHWYENRKQIKSVIIENGVASIGDYAFFECSGWTSIEIPNSVTSIGDYAFYSCGDLTYIEIPNGVTSIGEKAFSWCPLTSVTIGKSVTIIGEKVFQYCNNLTSVTIGNSVTSIGKNAFSCCYSLTSIDIPNSVTSLGYGAFADCSGLTSITCESVTPPALGDEVFHTVDKAIPLYVPAASVDAYKAADQWKDFNVQAIPGTGPCITATGTCGAQGDNLTWELSCDGVLTITGTGEMYNYGYQGASDFIFAPWNEYRESILSVIIEEGVTSIGRSAFDDCTSLTSVTIPSSITYIGELAFIVGETFADLYISNLAAWCNINFDGQPHEGCNPLFFAKNFYISGTKVVDVVIPESITSINNCALCVNFDNELAAIHSITFESATPPTIGDYYTFSYNTDLFVPCGALETYLSADNWSQYENRIQNAPSPYNIIVTPWGKGHIQQSEISVCGINIEAIPDEGYHFTKWSDGVTENPRTIVLTQDSSIMAEFLINR